MRKSRATRLVVRNVERYDVIVRVLTDNNMANAGGMCVILDPFAERVAHDLGATGGFKMQIQDRTDLGLASLEGAVANVRFGRNWQVNVQADTGFRICPEDIGKSKIRNVAGNTAPLVVEFAKAEEDEGVNRCAAASAAAIERTD